MNKESRALFWGLQHQQAENEILPLINETTAKAADPYYEMKPLFWALSYNASVEVVRQLIQAYPEAANEKHADEEWTPLHYAEKLNLESLKLLLSKCPDAVRQKDARGELPLHWAVEHDAPIDVVETLLCEYQEAAYQKDNLGRLPIKLAMDNEVKEEIISLLSRANPEGAATVPVALSADLPPSTIGLIFAGPGSQYISMMGQVRDMPAVQRMLEKAEEILGVSILDVCLNGPDETLQDPINCQPAIYIAGLAALEKLKAEKPEVAQRPLAVAGLSVGEFTALTAAGVFTFEDGLRLVKARAAAMKEAANLQAQAMLTVAGLSETKVKALCEEARKRAGPDSVCQISNYLFQKGFSVAGTKAAVVECLSLAQEAKALQARLIKTGAGDHTHLMEPAKKALEVELRKVLPRMKRPTCQVFMNVDAQPIDWTVMPDRIIRQLALQMTSAVRWRSCVEGMLNAGVTEFYECGPLKQLKAMMKRIDNAAWSNTTNVEV